VVVCALGVGTTNALLAGGSCTKRYVPTSWQAMVSSLLTTQIAPKTKKLLGLVMRYSVKTTNHESLRNRVDERRRATLAHMTQQDALRSLNGLATNAQLSAADLVIYAVAVERLFKKGAFKGWRSRRHQIDEVRCCCGVHRHQQLLLQFIVERARRSSRDRSISDQVRMARTYVGAPPETPVVLCIGSGIGGYSCWAGSPPSGVVTFKNHAQRLAGNPKLHMKVVIVPEPYTSKRCVCVCVCVCVPCAAPSLRH
jgi:hypothetical protein